MSANGSESAESKGGLERFLDLVRMHGAGACAWLGLSAAHVWQVEYEGKSVDFVKEVLAILEHNEVKALSQLGDLEFRDLTFQSGCAGPARAQLFVSSEACRAHAGPQAVRRPSSAKPWPSTPSSTSLLSPTRRMRSLLRRQQSKACHAGPSGLR